MVPCIKRSSTKGVVCYTQTYNSAERYE